MPPRFVDLAVLQRWSAYVRAVPPHALNMSRVERPSAIIRAGKDPHHEQAPSMPEAAKLDPDFVRRFHALVDEVADALMQGAPMDRQTARADAIALLVATCAAMGEAKQEDRGLLEYLLLEEQHKAAAALGKLSGVAQPAPGMVRA
jgi:hypothetical protein